MNGTFGQPSLWQRVKPIFVGFDLPLLLAILFLCGPGGAYITGQTHHVNGGAWMP